MSNRNSWGLSAEIKLSLSSGSVALRQLNLINKNGSKKKFFFENLVQHQNVWKMRMIYPAKYFWDSKRKSRSGFSGKIVVA